MFFVSRHIIFSSGDNKFPQNSGISLGFLAEQKMALPCRPLQANKSTMHTVIPILFRLFVAL